MNDLLFGVRKRRELWRPVYKSGTVVITTEKPDFMQSWSISTLVGSSTFKGGSLAGLLLDMRPLSSHDIFGFLQTVYSPVLHLKYLRCGTRHVRWNLPIRMRACRRGVKSRAKSVQASFNAQEKVFPITTIEIQLWIICPWFMHTASKDSLLLKKLKIAILLTIFSHTFMEVFQSRKNIE